MIVATGSLAYDYIMDFPGRFVDRILPDKIHQLSLSFLVDHLQKGMGGTAGNIAYTLALLGSPVTVVACVGRDFGPYQEFLSGAHVDTSFIHKVSDEYTATYFGITDMTDNQIGAFHTGAMKYTKNLRLDNFTPYDFVIIGPSDPGGIANFIDQCHEKHIPYLFDPAFQIATLSPETLRLGIEGAKILIGNDYEIALVQKKLSLSERELLDHIEVIVTTLGEKGSLIHTKEQKYAIPPAKPMEVVDPTGAGDAYRAGFLAGFTRGLDLETCGRMGSLTAVYTVEKYGTSTHTFTRDEFIKRYQENYSSPLSL